MPTPPTKQRLLNAIIEARKKLNWAFEGLSNTDMTQPGACGDWSVKDVLAHLVDWERRCVSWYQDGQRGEASKPLDEDYNWGQSAALNHAIYLKKYKDISLDEIIALYAHALDDMLAVAGAMSEEELNTPIV